MVLLLVIGAACSGKRITKANVDQVTEGMSKKQVESILAGTVDLGEAAEKSAHAFLVTHKRGKDRHAGSSALGVSEVGNDGVIRLRLWSQSPTVPNKGEV